VNRFTVLGSIAGEERVQEYKLSPGVRKGSETFDIYEATDITKNKYDAGLRRVWTRRLWINQKGWMIKYESIFTDFRGTSMTTISYEYDPTIKIEAPIKTKGKK
jgi:hypothetical protein